VARQTKRTTSGIPRPPDHHHSTGRPDAKFRRGGRAGKGTGSRHQTKNEPAGDRNECRGLTALSGPKRPTDLAANAQMITDDVASRETGAPRRRATRNQNGTDATTIRTDLQARGYVPGTDGVGIWILEDPEDEEDTGKKESQRRGVAKEKPVKGPRQAPTTIQIRSGMRRDRHGGRAQRQRNWNRGNPSERRKDYNGSHSVSHDRNRRIPRTLQIPGTLQRKHAPTPRERRNGKGPRSTESSTRRKHHPRTMTPPRRSTPLPERGGTSLLEHRAPWSGPGPARGSGGIR
jgi:hypothetical protein